MLVAGESSTADINHSWSRSVKHYHLLCKQLCSKRCSELCLQVRTPLTNEFSEDIRSHRGNSQRNRSVVLTDTTTLISSLSGHQQRRSAMTTEYDIPRTRTKFGDEAFSVAGPRECNSSRRYKKRHRLVNLQMSHQDTFLYWHIHIKQFYFCLTVLCSALLDNFLGEGGLRCII